MRAKNDEANHGCHHHEEQEQEQEQEQEEEWKGQRRQKGEKEKEKKALANLARAINGLPTHSYWACCQLVVRSTAPDDSDDPMTTIISGDTPVQYLNGIDLS